MLAELETELSRWKVELTVSVKGRRSEAWCVQDSCHSYCGDAVVNGVVDLLFSEALAVLPVSLLARPSLSVVNREWTQRILGCVGAGCWLILGCLFVLCF